MWPSSCTYRDMCTHTCARPLVWSGAMVSSQMLKTYMNWNTHWVEGCQISGEIPCNCPCLLGCFIHSSSSEVWGHTKQLRHTEWVPETGLNLWNFTFKEFCIVRSGHRCLLYDSHATTWSSSALHCGPSINAPTSSIFVLSLAWREKKQTLLFKWPTYYHTFLPVAPIA